MVSLLRKTFFSACLAPLLLLGVVAEAKAACPAVGQVWYSAERCARGPCWMYRVTGNNPRYQIFSVAVYKNAYYGWQYVRNDIYDCP